MDELKEAWNQIKDDTKSFTNIDNAELKEAIVHKSKGPLEGLRKKVYWKWLFCMFFTVVVAVGIPFVQILISQILLTVLLIAYTIGSILLFQEHKWLKENLDMSENVKSGLEKYYERIRKVIQYEEIIGLTLYPVSLTAGFFLGLSSGKAASEMMQTQEEWIALVLALIIFTPLAHLLTRWLNKKTFGKYMKQLKQNIDELGKQ